jgi:hypothetical protein
MHDTHSPKEAACQRGRRRGLNFSRLVELVNSRAVYFRFDLRGVFLDFVRARFLTWRFANFFFA